MTFRLPENGVVPQFCSLSLWERAGERANVPQTERLTLSLTLSHRERG
ncbi:hypothetical protein [Alysiella filiformis]|nr:hypothetical protein [Alysiella filiformis]